MKSNEEIKSAWKAVLPIHYSLIEKGVDSEGWYSNERNDQWLPLQGSDFDKYDLRNNNTEVRPKSLREEIVATDKPGEVMTAQQVLDKHALKIFAETWTGVAAKAIYDAMEEYASQYKQPLIRTDNSKVIELLQSKLDNAEQQVKELRKALELSVVELEFTYSRLSYKGSNVLYGAKQALERTKPCQ